MLMMFYTFSVSNIASSIYGVWTSIWELFQCIWNLLATTADASCKKTFPEQLYLISHIYGDFALTFVLYQITKHKNRFLNEQPSEGNQNLF